MAVVNPVTNYICEMLPDGVRETKPGELAYEDLEKLQPEDILRLSEWLIDKVPFPAQVDVFCSADTNLSSLHITFAFIPTSICSTAKGNRRLRWGLKFCLDVSVHM